MAICIIYYHQACAGFKNYFKTWEFNAVHVGSSLFSGEKDRVNAQLAWALVGTTRLYADVRE